MGSILSEKSELGILLQKARGSSSAHQEFLKLTVGGVDRYAKITVKFFESEQGDAGHWTLIGTDVTEDFTRSKTSEIQNKMLELVVKGAPLNEVLPILTDFVESRISPEAKASILLVDKDQKRLRHGVGPKLPESYNKVIDGLRIGPEVGSCGTAAFLKKPVIVSNIQKDPKWVPFQELAQQHGFKACWSFPIFATQKNLLGTFAVYFDSEKEPDSSQLNHLVNAAAVAGFIIENVMNARHLLETQERLSLALTSGSIGLWDWNAKTGDTYLSQTLMQDWGIDPEAFNQTLSECFDCIHPADRERVRQEIDQATRQQKPYDIEYRVVRPQGEIIWIQARGRVISDAGGNPERLVGVTTNVTSHKAQEWKLAEERAKFQAITDAMPQMVWSTLPDGFHDYYNKRWYEFTGVPEGSTDGDGWSGMFHPEDQEQAWSAWRHSLQTGEPYQVEYRLRHRSGEYRWTLGRALPVRDQTGKITRWMGTCTDIQSQKDAEASLRRSGAELEQMVQSRTRNLETVNQELEAFSYSVSHDLRTPLRSIEGFSQALMEDESAKLSDRGKKDLKRIIEAGQNMGRLIDDLLSLSRLSKREISFQPLDLSALANDIVQKLKESNPMRDLQIQIDKTPPVLGDRGLLLAFLENLLANAWKFTGRKEKAYIHFGSKLIQDQVIFFIQDNGAGFDMAHYPKMFGAFQRLHQVREFPGSGIGLALVRRIINRHGGEVWAEGEINKGAVFYFKIPMA